MMFSKTNKKLLLMLSIFLCLACVVGSVAAADVNNNNVTDDSDSNSIAIDDAVIVDSDSNSIAIDDAGAYIPSPFPIKIDYKHLPVGTTITIKIPTHLVVEWVVGDCTGVELIKEYDDLFNQSFMFKVTSENYNIILNSYNRYTIVGSTVATYNFTDNPFEYGAKVSVKVPVNIIGSDVIQMDSLSVVDDAVKQPVNTCLSCFNVPTTNIGGSVPQFPYEIILHAAKTVETVPALYSFAINKIVDFFKHIF